jgi:hypothetical protein
MEVPDTAMTEAPNMVKAPKVAKKKPRLVAHYGNATDLKLTLSIERNRMLLPKYQIQLKY